MCGWTAEADDTAGEKLGLTGAALTVAPEICTARGESGITEVMGIIRDATGGCS